MSIILLVIFGAPRETPTILGLATAALTIALQDFIIGVSRMVRPHGQERNPRRRWVEINGVGGEVIEIGLIQHHAS